eukprot:scaffold22069_cov122-Isochrysis_galbana.AAC.7
MAPCIRYCVSSISTGWPARCSRSNKERPKPWARARLESTVAGSCIGSPTRPTSRAPCAIGTSDASSPACAASSSSTTSKPPATSLTRFSAAADIVQKTISHSSRTSALSGRSAARSALRLAGGRHSRARSSADCSPAWFVSRMIWASNSAAWRDAKSEWLMVAPAAAQRHSEQTVAASGGLAACSRKAAHCAAHRVTFCWRERSTAVALCCSGPEPPASSIAWRTARSRSATRTSSEQGPPEPRDPTRAMEGR